MYPYSFVCYLGKIRIEYRNETMSKIKQKLIEILNIVNIGKFKREGLGKVQWKRGWIENNINEIPKLIFKRKLRIRKGLPLNLSLDQQELIKYALLHDFFHTPKHLSKIYIEPSLNNIVLEKKLRMHHDKTNDPLINKFQKYDRLAAMITRKMVSPVTNRYTWYAKKMKDKVDFKILAKEIKEVSKNIWTLYKYIFDSKELKWITESMKYGHNNLQNHLLTIVNLIVQDFNNEKIQLVEETSTKST